jgi:DNA repair exonuclease SbcCD ATPase subunit
MINHLITKLEELEQRKKALEPKFEEINSQREKEIQSVNTKYDHIIADINYEIKQIENSIYNEMIESFANIISRELEVKRSNSLYSVSEEFKEYRESISKLTLFPKELIKKLDKVINGSPIEDIIYILDDIKTKYLKH